MAGEDGTPVVKGVHLTPYDVLGYLAPGGVLILATGAFEAFVHRSTGPVAVHTPVYTTLSKLMNAASVNDSWAFQALVLLVAGVMAYVLGHIVASLSALVIDRWYVHKGHGYPYQYLLGLDLPKIDSYSRDFYRGFFFWLNLYLLLRYLTLPNGVPLPQFIPKPFRDWIPGLIQSPTNLYWAAETVGWGLLIMLAAKLLLSVQKPHRRLRRGIAWPLERFLYILAVPAKLITNFLGNYLHTKVPLDPISAEAFKNRMVALLGIGPREKQIEELLGSSSTFWYAAIHLRTAAANVSAPAETWLRLYAFARNLAAALYLAFLYCFLWWYNQAMRLNNIETESHYVILVLPLVFWTCSFIMLLRYYYLYVDYYTKYILRAFVYLTRPTS